MFCDSNKVRQAVSGTPKIGARIGIYKQFQSVFALHHESGGPRNVRTPPVQPAVTSSDSQACWGVQLSRFPASFRLAKRSTAAARPIDRRLVAGAEQADVSSAVEQEGRIAPFRHRQHRERRVGCQDILLWSGVCRRRKQ